MTRIKRVEKFTKPLPARSTLNDLTRSERTIQDYSKAVDDKETSMPAVLGFLKRAKRP